MSFSASLTVYMPQPISTPTTLGTAFPWTVIVVPIVQPLPACTSGMIRTLLPSVKSKSHIRRICSIASSSTTVA